jgi:protein-S-isoprenylcysteine O-methyltransferase Ste14
MHDDAGETEDPVMDMRRMQRGEAWVAAQGVFFACWLAAPLLEGRWPHRMRLVALCTGLPLATLGAVALGAGARHLGSNLTALPYPKPRGTLVDDGIYGVVRHPIYSGVLLLMFGGALVSGRLARLVVALGACIFFDAKARREEHWLTEHYPDYPAYRRRVRKFIPGLY